MKTYDYIIIGAGTAGCVLAARLSENTDNQILVLEAGGYPTPASDDPKGWVALMGSEMDWSYKTESQPGLLNRQVYQPRGKGLGGTSTINGMLYTRPLRYDFDQWAYQGAVGWEYNAILPYLQKVEHFENKVFKEPGKEGTLNLVTLRSPDPTPKIYETIMQAAQQLDYPVFENFSNPDFCEGSSGLGWFSASIKNGKRHGAFQAYLQPALGRKNLIVQTYARASRLIFDGNHCMGVEYVNEEKVHTVYANKEVLLCAGSIESPKLLLLSGLGPAGELAELNIPIQANLPGVGKNFHDHVTVSCQFALDGSIEDASEGLCRMALFTKSDPAMLVPDIEVLIMMDQSKDEEGNPYTLLSMHTSIQRPASKGWIKLAGNDPEATPRIHPNLLADPVDLDRLKLGITKVRELANTEPLKQLIKKELKPGTDIQLEAELEQFIRENGQSQWHICGSCKMGIDEMAVVGPDLKVRGVENLRIVDCSVWPMVVTGHAQASMFAIAERAVDLIQATASQE